MIPYFDSDDEDEKQAVVIELELDLSKLDERFTEDKYLNYDDKFAEFVIKNRNNPDTL